MNIVFYLPNINLGGIAQNSIKLSREFVNKGHNVTFILHRYGGEYTAIMPESISIENLKVSNVLFALPRIEKYIKTHDIDLLITSRDLNNSLVLLWNHIRKIQCNHLMATCHTNAIIEHREFKRISRKIKTFVYMKLARMTYKWADSIVCVSKGVAEATAKYSNIPIEKIKVIYNPIVTEDFEERKNEIITEAFWKDTNGKKVLIGAGRLTEQKNWPLLIKAFSKISKIDDNAILIILGEGELRGALETLINNLGLSEKVIMPGYISNPLKFVSKSDLFISTSNWEGFGNAIAEALATGTKVIATDCPSGPAEILDYGKYGVLVPTEDEEMLVKAIQECLHKDWDKELLVNRGLDFSTEKIAEEYLKVVSMRLWKNEE